LSSFRKRGQLHARNILLLCFRIHFFA